MNQETHSTDMTVRVFVYGTLREGAYNNLRVGRSNEFRAATTTGRIYHVDPHGYAYPVAKFDEEGTIVGEVHEFDERRWNYIVVMEEGAGYRAVPVIVTYDDGETEEVLGWQYIHSPRGPLIESGDWFDVKEMDSCEMSGVWRYAH